MKKFGIFAGALAAGALAFATGAFAAPVNGTGNVTPDVIFGSGNANGSFTGVSANNVEVGLRAKVRFPTPMNVFNYDGVDTYTMDIGESAPASGRPLWNFEWSVNSDVSGTAGRNLDDLTYALRLDQDSTAGVSFLPGPAFDPIIGPFFDHAIGNNGTANGGGTVATDPVNYAALIGSNNVAQNSWAYHWFSLIDPLVAGNYAIELAVSNLSGELASTRIYVQVGAVPIPPAAFLFGTVLLGGGIVSVRRRRKVASV